MWRQTRYALGVLLSTVIAAGSAATTIAGQAASGGRLKQLEDYEHARLRDLTPEDQRNRLIVAEYDHLFPYQKAGVESMSDDDLQASFKAAYLAAFFSIDQPYISEMKTYLDALDQRHIASASDYIKMHDIFIAARMFNDANEVEATHADLDMEKAPLITGQRGPAHEPSRLTIAPRGTALNYERVDLKGKVLVVIAHPLCHFSVNAVREISEQPLLSQIFKDAIWLAPPGTRLNIPDLRLWNSDHPDATLALMDQRRDWPMFDAWATPTFYFLNNGKVIEKVEGWPPTNGLDGFFNAANRWKAAR